MGNWRVMTKEHGIYFWGGENILKLIMMMDVQLCEYTESHWCDPFNWVNCVVWELYLDEDFKIKDKK